MFSVDINQRWVHVLYSNFNSKLCAVLEIVLFIVPKISGALKLSSGFMWFWLLCKTQVTGKL